MHRTVPALAALALLAGCVSPHRSAASGVPPTLARNEALPPREASHQGATTPSDESFLGWLGGLFGGGPSSRSAEPRPVVEARPAVYDPAHPDADERGVVRARQDLERAAPAPREDDPRWAAGGAYDWRLARFAATVEGSRAIQGGARLWGGGLYVIPRRSPFGLYVNARASSQVDGDPDLSGVFSFNQLGHDVVATGTQAWILNAGALHAFNESVVVFGGLGYATTDEYAELRDPGGVFLGGHTYYQRRSSDEELNVNFGALVLVHPVAVTVQWDTALEVVSFGLGLSF